MQPRITAGCHRPCLQFAAAAVRHFKQCALYQTFAELHCPSSSTIHTRRLQYTSAWDYRQQGLSDFNRVGARGAGRQGMQEGDEKSAGGTQQAIRAQYPLPTLPPNVPLPLRTPPPVPPPPRCACRSSCPPAETWWFCVLRALPAEQRACALAASASASPVLRSVDDLMLLHERL